MDQYRDLPDGELDQPDQTISGDPNRYGQVYVGFLGGGFAYLPASSGSARRPSPGSSIRRRPAIWQAGKTVALKLTFSEAVTVAGGAPTLTLNDGGLATYASGSGTSALTFNYTVAAGQNTASLAATAVNLPSGATIKDSSGNAANLSLAGLAQSGPQIGTVTPTITAITDSPATGDLNAGKSVALTLSFNENVTVAGGTPTLTLERRRRRDLRQRLRHQRADLQLHRGGGTEHARPDGDGGQSQCGEHQG